MLHQPLVSVIITTFNRADKVGNCINSILEQDYNNLEIIIVDDCSTDNTEEFIKSNFIKKVKYIRHHLNQGVNFASNTGFKHASGKYVAFIGDDDRWIDKKKLAEQVEIFENDRLKKYGIITTDFNVVGKKNNYRKNIQKPKNLVKHILAGNGIISGTAALLRSDIFKQAGMFSEELPKGTDSDVYRRIILLGYDVYFIYKSMVECYWNNDDRMSTLNETGINKSIIAHFYKLKTYNNLINNYPSVKSDIYFQLALLYFKKYYICKSIHTKYLSKKYFKKSLISNPINFKSWFYIIKLYLGINNLN